MAIRAGDSLLHYRVLDKIGEGGMGEVWRARDTTLDRDVAIKLLPPAFSSDPDRLSRFEREAKLLASLNHPHIAAIYGLHEDRGQRFLAMELVPGEDLSTQIRRHGETRRPSSEVVEWALPIARRIAEALEYAHERGIVHRDLKPANIKITPDGDVKVLDFGLAKALDPMGASGPDAMNSPTLTAPGTQMGVILGTAAYMSPEQARGKAVDKRADNWAFGCVVYEMLTGSQLFTGETVTDLLAGVVTRDPDWTKLPASVPPSVRQLVQRCLDKDVRTRLRDIGEARIVLANPGARNVESQMAGRVAPARVGVSLLWPLIAAATLIVGVVAGRFFLAPAAPPRPWFEFDVTVPGRAMEIGSFALSPDGLHLALLVRDESGDRSLAVRTMTQAQARILANTRNAEYPFWSPDGKEIGYFVDKRLYRIALEDGVPRPLAAVADPRGGTWNAAGVILVGNAGGPIQKISADGGRTAESITKLASNEDAHIWPVFLPDGKRYVFLADAATTEGHHLYLANLDGSPAKVLKNGIRSQPLVDPNGRILLVESGQLLGYPFDPNTGVIGDTAVTVAAQVYPIGTNHLLPASVAPGGMVAYQSVSPESRLVVLNKNGDVVKTIGEPDRYGNPRISPNGRRVSFELFSDSPDRLVWVQDLERGVRTQISTRGQLADGSAWGPDSETLYFDSNEGGAWAIFRKPVTGGGSPQNLGATTPTDTGLFDVSADGHWIVAGPTAAHAGLFLRSTAADGKWALWTTPATLAAFSPDARWIAYCSDASTRSEVYVAPREGGPTVHQWQISSTGGFEPRFSPDGHTLYYRTASFDWMAVDIKVIGDRIEAGAPHRLFALPPTDPPYLKNLMDVMPDGSGFLAVRPVSTQAFSIRVRTGK